MKMEQSGPNRERSLRVPLIADPEWVEKIDNWGFANRIRSRAEAIRRLACIGLEAEGANTKQGEAA